jgi:hypothetical protein
VHPQEAQEWACPSHPEILTAAVGLMEALPTQFIQQFSTNVFIELFTCGGNAELHASHPPSQKKTRLNSASIQHTCHCYTGKHTVLRGGEINVVNARLWRGVHENESLGMGVAHSYRAGEHGGRSGHELVLDVVDLCISARGI